MSVVNRLERRVGRDQVAAHLEAVGGTAVTGMAELDVAVWRVERGDRPTWVARLLSPSRPFAWAEGDVEILRLLEDRGFPAERLAGPQPLAELDGHALVVTGHVDGVPREARRETIRQLGGLRRLGDLLGQLTTMPDTGGAAARPGGGWHHLLDGTPDEEVAATAEMVNDAALRVADGGQADVDVLRRAVDWIDGAGGLPEALIHPDFALPNVVASPEEMVLVDWTGVGRGPRLWPLAWLLWTAGAPDLRRVPLVCAGYRPHVRLEPEELDRLAPVAAARPVMLQVWSWWAGRQPLAGTARSVTEAVELATAVAERARAELLG